MAKLKAFNSVKTKALPQKPDQYLIDGNGIGQQMHGNMRVGNKGTGEVLMDGQNGRIVISDGTNPRIVIGDV